MKVRANLLFEMNAKDFAVEFATFGRPTDNWTEACDEQNFEVARSLHGTPLTHCIEQQVIFMQLADARNTVNKADVCSIDVDITPCTWLPAAPMSIMCKLRTLTIRPVDPAGFKLLVVARTPAELDLAELYAAPAILMANSGTIPQVVWTSVSLDLACEAHTISARVARVAYGCSS
ncbi:hypothetical protein Q8F57_033250 [Paraburkholderia terrae]|uniref:hypothetical protein n=1 Tax=Paraburkholderia terrae TaxID=311230 RepID=UPI00296B301A|nr:hypothetical protein [Paraburkholderia terrae]MDW3657822.1 hypothetical protein [Paraburkholderia terrae]